MELKVSVLTIIALVKVNTPMSDKVINDSTEQKIAW